MLKYRSAYASLIFALGSIFKYGIIVLKDINIPNWEIILISLNHVPEWICFYINQR
jgi:hypothetical protein